MVKDFVFNVVLVIRNIIDKDIKDYDIYVNVIGGGKIDGFLVGVVIIICIMSVLLNKLIR